jgi:predicted nucleic acid-binding protein
MLFCDTSTLAKFYVSELGSEAVVARLEAEPAVLLSHLARVELLAVFHRRLREGRWSRADHEATVQQFLHDDAQGRWVWAPVDTETLARVGEIFLALPDSVFLRTADCIHLVTALRQGFDTIHTHDRHQSLAAEHLGLRAITLS